MQHITYRPVDRQFQCLAKDLPTGATFNGVDPIGGIKFAFALTSRYPEEIFYGTIEGATQNRPDIELRVITKEEFNAARAADAPPLGDVNGAINTERDRRIATPFVFEEHEFQSDNVSRDRIDKARGSALAAILGGAKPGDLRWTGEPLDFIWISLDDTHVPMDAPTTVRFGNYSAAREGRLIVTANALKKRAAAGEQLDISNDDLWS